MPPNDVPARPSRRRALGRGPGTSSPGRDAPPRTEPADESIGQHAAPDGAGRSSLPDSGGSDDPAREAAPDGGQGLPAPRAEPAGTAPPCTGPDTVEDVPAPERIPHVGGGDVPAPAGTAPRIAPPGAGTAAEPGSSSGGARGGDGAHGGEGHEPGDGASGPGQPADGAAGGDGRFTVRLVNFEGPFDLLLQLISKHKLDVTEVALSKVTDEFMAHIRAMGPDWDLDQTTEFLVVAATLLDLKAARLLPAAQVEDEADLALLEARDLLFARLLQYRAYKQIAEIFDGRLDDEARRFPRTVGLEPHLAELLPDVVIGIGAEGFARLAVKAMQPKSEPQVYVDHIHAPLVSVQEQAEVVVGLLRERGRATFQELTEGVDDTLTVVARFLALLELYREKAVVLAQVEALGELSVVWAGGESVSVTDEFDRTVEETS